MCCTAAAEVRAILEDPQADSLSPSTPDFWLMVAALRKFVVGNLIDSLLLHASQLTEILRVFWYLTFVAGGQPY